MSSYGSRVLSQAEALKRKVESLNGEPFDASQLFYAYSFDVMGDVTFDTKFNMLNGGDTIPATEVFRSGAWAKTFFTPVPWMFELFKAIPNPKTRWRRMWAWSRALVEERMKVI